jgi:aminoglycoside 2'-N-acetyltransferase I
MVPTEELRADEIRILRELFDAAWESEPDDFEDEDWEHAVGGLHFVLEDQGAIVAHASVGERELHTGGHELATGYVEAVATRPTHQRRGHGSAIMREVGAHIDRTFQLGALGGDPAFYEPLGWTVWEGPTFVRAEAGLVRTPEEDGSVLVRPTPATPPLGLTAPISCDWRPGDVW